MYDVYIYTDTYNNKKKNKYATPIYICLFIEDGRADRRNDATT